MLNPWLAAMTGFLPMFALGVSSYVTIMTTEGANVVLRNAWMSSGRPTEVLFRRPRESLGDPSGLWGKISVGGNRYWVHRYFHSDVRLANDLLAYPDTPPAPQLQ